MPKLYFWDTGLLAWLLGIEKASQVATHYAVGAIFENAVIAELAKSYYNRGEVPRFYFFRDSNGNEVDLLIEHGRKIKALEIKYGKTIHPESFRGLNTWNKISGQSPENGFLVYGGAQSSTYNKFNVVPWTGIQQIAGV